MTNGIWTRLIQYSGGELIECRICIATVCQVQSGTPTPTPPRTSLLSPPTDVSSYGLVLCSQKQYEVQLALEKARAWRFLDVTVVRALRTRMCTGVAVEERVRGAGTASPPQTEAPLHPASVHGGS